MTRELLRTSIDLEELSIEGRLPERASEYLGPDLAAWMLPPEARRSLGIAPPRLPCACGAAVVLFCNAMRGPCASPLPGLASGFGLPFSWREGCPDSDALPDGMPAVAESVRRALGIDSWGLGMDECLAHYDLSALPMGCESAWAPLAAALLVAREGGHPKPAVFATGRWQGRGIESVDGMAEKIEAAVALPGETDRPVLWAPAGNYDEASRLAAGRCDVKAFPAGIVSRQERPAVAAISGYLLDLDSPPDVAAPLEHCLNWANREWVMTDHPLRQDYYRTHLVVRLADRLRREFPLPPPPVGRLAVGLGFNYELATLVIRALRPARVRLVPTRDSRSLAAPLLASVADLGVEVETADDVSSADPAGSGRVAEALAAWLRDAPPGTGSAVDITGGTVASPSRAHLRQKASTANVRSKRTDGVMPRPGRTAPDRRGKAPQAAGLRPAGPHRRAAEGRRPVRSVYVNKAGATLRREGEVLQVWVRRDKEAEIRLHEMDQLVLMGNIIITPAALDLLIRHGVDTVLLTTHGRYRARIVTGVSTHVRLRLAQYGLLADGARALDLARRIVAGKARNQRALLLRHVRERGGGDAERLAELSMRAALARLDLCLTLDQVRGCEGSVSASYFRVFGRMLRAEGFSFDGRSRRPPMDPVNALLSLGYTLLFNAVESAVHVVGLDPYVGALHAVEDARPSLVCDLVEEHRAPLVDRLVLAAINREAVRPDDFEGAGPAEPVVVKREALRWFVTLFERRLSKAVLYPPTGTRLPYRQVIEQQVRRLARHVLGREQYACFEPR
ncbi:MAG: CRISPR-associated endonuclease Cas1 [Myxococcota bacterium]|nr:CRISPR-associated endonuclease Cas1 [Myxococcota bacterium]